MALGTVFATVSFVYSFTMLTCVALWLAAIPRLAEDLIPWLTNLLPYDVDMVRVSPGVWKAVPPTSFLSSLQVNGALLTVFVIQHSGMARPAFKKWLAGMGWPQHLERSLFLLITGMLMQTLITCFVPCPTPLIYAAPPALHLACIGVQFAGVALLLAGIASIDPLYFFGLKQATHPEGAKANVGKKAGALIVRGLYGLVRHPMMSGLFLILWGHPVMSLGRLVLTVGATLYAAGATLCLEERDLRAELGPDFDAYRQSVPAFFPTSLCPHAKEFEEAKKRMQKSK